MYAVVAFGQPGLQVSNGLQKLREAVERGVELQR